MQFSFYYLWYGAVLYIYKRHLYWTKTLTLRTIYEYASERSERAKKIFTFSYSKTAISFNILLVLQILCLRNTFISGLK